MIVLFQNEIKVNAPYLSFIHIHNMCPLSPISYILKKVVTKKCHKIKKTLDRGKEMYIITYRCPQNRGNKNKENLDN